MTANEYAVLAEQYKYEAISRIAEWMYNVDNTLPNNKDIHYKIWDIPTWIVTEESYSFQSISTEDGDVVAYTFTYTDPYEDYGDREVVVVVYDKWLDMSIEDVCKDIVRMSDEMYEQDRQQELAELKRQIKSAGVSKEMLADMF